MKGGERSSLELICQCLMLLHPWWAGKHPKFSLQSISLENVNQSCLPRIKHKMHAGLKSWSVRNEKCDRENMTHISSMEMKDELGVFLVEWITTTSMSLTHFHTTIAIRYCSWY